MRLVDQPLAVVARGCDPLSFHWHKKKYLVAAVLERWADTGAWWQGESEKMFYRLLADDGGLYEFYREQTSGSWYMYKVYD